jgi:hypothetical protein
VLLLYRKGGVLCSGTDEVRKRQRWVSRMLSLSSNRSPPRREARGRQEDSPAQVGLELVAAISIIYILHCSCFYQ